MTGVVITFASWVEDRGLSVRVHGRRLRQQLAATRPSFSAPALPAQGPHLIEAHCVVRQRQVGEDDKAAKCQREGQHVQHTQLLGLEEAPHDAGLRRVLRIMWR